MIIENPLSKIPPVGEPFPVETPAEKTANIVKINPALMQHPGVIDSLVKNTNAPGHVIAGVTKFLGDSQDIKHVVSTHSENNPHAGGWWNDVTHFASGAWDSAKTTGLGLAKAANRAIITAGEIGSFGALGSDGLLKFSQNMSDASNTFSNFTNTALNPMTDWKLLSRSYAYWQSQVNRHGAAYGAGELLPIFLSSLFGGEVADAAGIGGVASDAGITADASNLAKIEEAANSGKITADQMLQRESILMRQGRRAAQEASTQSAKDKIFDYLSQAGKFGKNANKADKASRWVTTPMGAALRTLGKQVGGIRTNLLYAATAAHANGSADHSALWNNQYVQAGIPIDSEGRPTVNSFGQSFANSIGLHSGGLYDAASHGAQIGQMFVADPFGQALQITRGAARTAEGAGRVLGRWWPGIGAETGADVIRNAQKTARSNTAIDYMATHGLSDIKKSFPRMYTEEQYKWLSQAKTAEEVIKIHADIADGVGLTRRVLPTMGLGKFLLSKTRDGLMSWQKVTEDFSKSDEAARQTVEGYGIVDFKPTSATEAASSSIIRGNAVFRRWLATRVTRKAMYIVEATHLGQMPFVETKVMSSSDPNIISALVDAFKGVGVFNDREIATMSDTLTAIPNYTDLTAAIANHTGALFEGGLSRLTNAPSLQDIQSITSTEIEEHVNKIYNISGGGRGEFVNGELGSILSVRRSPTDATITGSFGIANEHIGNLVIPEPRYELNFLKSYAKAVSSLSGSEIDLAAELGIIESVNKASKYANATLEGVTKNLIEKNAQKLKLFRASSVAASNAYETQMRDIINQIEIIKTNRNLVPYEAHAQILNNLWAHYEQLVTVINEGHNPVIAAQLHAVRDVIDELKSQISEPALTDAHIKSLSEQIANSSLETQQMRKKIRNVIHDELKKSRDKQGNFTSNVNHLSNGANHLISKWCVPLMLSTGGYITRIMGSELLLSLAKIGPSNLIASRIADSVAKSLVKYGRPLEEGKFIQRIVGEQLGHIVGDWAQETKNLMKGTATGAAMGIGRGILGEEFNRLLSNSIDLRILFPSLPDIGHSTSQLYGESTFRQGSRQMVYGTEEKNGIITPTMGKRFRGSKFVKADGTISVTALRDNMALLANDKFLRPAMEPIVALLEKNNFAPMTTAEFDSLWAEAVDSQYKFLLNLPSNDLRSLRANVWPLADRHVLPAEIKDYVDPLHDLAISQVYNNLNVVTGRNAEGLYVPHKYLVQSIIDNKIPDSASFSRIVAKMGKTAPSHLVTPEFLRHPWEDSLANHNKFINAFLNAPSRLNAAIVDKTFGHMISYASREPQYAWKYHQFMEAQADKIASNVMSKEEAMLFAQNEAFHEMVKFVHNPADRFIYEARSRAVAPFWFAKNQMYRRALRLLEIDPYSFYNYMRYSTMATVGISKYAVNNNSPGWLLPIVDSPLWLLMRVAKMMPAGLDKSFLTGLGMTMAENPTSLNSVLITGTSIPQVKPGSSIFDYMLGTAKHVASLAKPDVSPPVAMALEHFNNSRLGDTKWTHDAINSLLGPIGSKQGDLANLLPSTFYRGVATLGVGVGDTLRGSDLSGPVAVLQVRAMHASLDSFNEMLVNYYRKNNPGPINDAYLKAENTWVEYNFANYLNNGASVGEGNLGVNAQHLINHSKGVALGLYAAYLVSYFPSPISIHLKDTFSKSGDFQKFLAMKNPDGTDVSFGQAITLWSLKHPQNLIDLVSSYQKPYGNYPATQKTLSWIDKAPQLVKEFPKAIPYFIPVGGKYLPAAHETELSFRVGGLALARPDTAAEYFRAVMTNSGDSYYYNGLEPEYYKQYGTYLGPDNPQNTISSFGYKALQAAAKTYAINNNLIWDQEGSPLSLVGKAHAVSALNDVQKFLGNSQATSEAVRSGLISSSDVKSAQEALSWYNSQVNYANTLNGTGRWNVRQNISQVMLANSKDSNNLNLASLFLLLSRAPTINPSS